MHAHHGVRRIGIGLGVAGGALAAAAVVHGPLAHADEYEIDPVGSGTVLNDAGIPGLFAYGQVTQEIGVEDVTTGELATGSQAGTLDVTENIFTSPLGSVAFIDGANATDGTGTLATDVGNASDYDLVFGSLLGGVDGYGNIPLTDIDNSALFSAVPADDFGLSGLGADSLTPGLETVLNLF